VGGIILFFLFEQYYHDMKQHNQISPHS